MAPQYKLTFFSAMAIAEPIRWLLSYGKLPFDDVRITPDDWRDMKDNLKFGILPIFEVDGKPMFQSLAICRYVAKVVGLDGKNDWENFKIDMAADFVSDLRQKIAVYNKLPDAAPNRPSLKESLISETIPYYLSRFENMAETEGYLATERLTWADIYFVALLDYNNGVLDMDIIDPEKYPNLDRIRTEVRAIPEIAAWIHTRPYTVF